MTHEMVEISEVKVTTFRDDPDARRRGKEHQRELCGVELF